MKIKTILFLSLICFLSCQKDNEVLTENLAENIIGEYFGTLAILGDSVIYFDNYDVLVSSSKLNIIRVESLSGNEFNPIELDLERRNENTITGHQELDQVNIQFGNHFSTTDSLLYNSISISSNTIAFDGKSTE